jgi:predicted ATPase
MISVDLCDTVARYRLLDTTRAFAQAKLAESGRHREVIARHACYVADRLGKFDMNALALEGETREANDLLGDVRAALPWAFSDEGDRNTALRIAVHCGHFLIPFSLVDEVRRNPDHDPG